MSSTALKDRILENHVLNLLSGGSLLRSVLESRVSLLRRTLNIDSTAWRFKFNDSTFILPLDVAGDVTAKLVRRILEPARGARVSAEHISLPVMILSLDSILTLVHWGYSRAKLARQERAVLEARHPEVSLLGIIWARGFQDVSFERLSGLPLDAYLLSTIRFPRLASPKTLEPFSDTTFVIPGDDSVKIYSIYKSVCRLKDKSEVRRSRFKEGYGNVRVELVDRDFRVQELLIDIPYEDLDVVRERGGVFNAIIVREDTVERDEWRYVYTAHLLDMMRLKGLQVGEYEFPLELLEVLRDEYLKSSSLTRFRWNSSRLREVLRGVRPRLDRKAFDSLWAKVLDDEESLKLIVNSTGIYRVCDNTVIYMHPAVIELILRLGGSFNIYSKDIFDLPFKISEELEDLKGKFPMNPLDVISFMSESSRLSDMLSSIPNVKLGSSSVLLSILKATIDIIYRSKGYNSVVEGATY